MLYGVSCVVLASRAQAQAQAGGLPPSAASVSADVAPPASTSQAAPPTPATPTPAESATTSQLAARLDELSRRVEEQAAELARQRAELDAHRSQTTQAAHAPTAGGSTTDADAQVAEFLGQDTAAPAAFEPSLHIYGFADMGLQRIWGGFFDSGLALSDATNFVLGNVNVYFDAAPIEHIRVLTEVRFTTFPDGEESYDPKNGGLTRQSTAVYDSTSAVGGFVAAHWGGIILERAHIDWTPYDAFNVRVGYFLTPYGIWNVDHGSPTRIMLRPPLITSFEYMPERQTGVDFYGVIHMLPWELGYDAYVSNGRVVGSVDFDDDKAVGGRVFMRTRRPFPIQLGASIFKGSTEDESKTFSVTNSQVVVNRTQTVAYDELAGGGDVSIDIDALRIRAELVARRIVYEPGKRATRLGALEANNTDFGSYLLAAYRLPWFGLEPLLVTELLRYPNVQFGEYFVVPGVGLNVYFNPSTTLRIQYSYVKTFDLEPSHGIDHSKFTLNILASRLIVAF